MYSWTKTYETVEQVKEDLNLSYDITTAGLYIDPKDFFIVARIDVNGRTLWDGKPTKTDSIRIYVFNELFADSVFGKTLKTVVDNRG